MLSGINRVSVGARLAIQTSRRACSRTQKLHSLPLQTAEQQGKQASASTRSLKEQDGEGPTEVEMLVRGGSRVTRAAQLMWGQFVKPGDFVVDATCGNGGDTLWLSRAVGPTGRVLALDVQDEALSSTRNLLEWELPEESWPSLDLVKDCHSNMKAHMEGGAPSLVCFNLGYLPWTDKAVMTTPQTTLAALNAALECLKPGGMLSVISYVGHEGGLEEHDAVVALLSGLNSQKWTVCMSRIINRPTAPILSVAIKSTKVES